MLYNTEQKKQILGFLQTNSQAQYTIDEIAEALSGCVGKSTVYRQIPFLVKEGAVKRFTAENNRKSVYQAVVGFHCDAHLHMKCMRCGKLLHMPEALSDQLIGLVNEKSSFAIDEEETVLFGRCEGCKNKQTDREGGA
ncbi:MAG: Fur family transcriptional regulator [Clostridiales bacterium]|nr:Fur family transcriptional regulator [Clostridiales bacterium]